MKQENSIGTNDVLTIWNAQLLIFALKADLHDLALLRNEIVCRVRELCCVDSSRAIAEKLVQSSHTLCRLMAQRYSLVPEAEQLLTEKVKEFCTEYIAGKDISDALTAFRTMDAMTGLISGLTQKQPLPFSLLDYVLDIILPVIGGDLVMDLCNEIDNCFDDEGHARFDLDVIEQKLKLIVKRLCFNSCLDKNPTEQLSLAILMHLPKNNKDFAMKTGFIYKLLQAKYAHQEVR